MEGNGVHFQQALSAKMRDGDNAMEMVMTSAMSCCRADGGDLSNQTTDLVIAQTRPSEVHLRERFHVTLPLKSMAHPLTCIFAAMMIIPISFSMKLTVNKESSLLSQSLLMSLNLTPLGVAFGYLFTAIAGLSTTWTWLLVALVPIFSFLITYFLMVELFSFGVVLPIIIFACVIIRKAVRRKLFCAVVIWFILVIYPSLIATGNIGKIVESVEAAYPDSGGYVATFLKQFNGLLGNGILMQIWKCCRGTAPREMFTILICFLVLVADTVQLISVLGAATGRQAATTVLSGVVFEVAVRMNLHFMLWTAVWNRCQFTPDPEMDLMLRERLAYSYAPPMAGVCVMSICSAFGLPPAGDTWLWQLLTWSIMGALGTDTFVCLLQWWLFWFRTGRAESLLFTLGRLHTPAGHLTPQLCSTTAAQLEPAVGGDEELPGFFQISGNTMAAVVLAVFTILLFYNGFVGAVLCPRLGAALSELGCSFQG